MNAPFYISVVGIITTFFENYSLNHENTKVTKENYLFYLSKLINISNVSFNLGSDTDL